MRAHASIFSANKYFQIKVLNPYRVFVDRYERDSVVVGIVGMCITGCLTMACGEAKFSDCGGVPSTWRATVSCTPSRSKKASTRPHKLRALSSCWIRPPYREGQARSSAFGRHWAQSTATHTLSPCGWSDFVPKINILYTAAWFPREIKRLFL